MMDEEILETLQENNADLKKMAEDNSDLLKELSDECHDLLKELADDNKELLEELAANFLSKFADNNEATLESIREGMAGIEQQIKWLNHVVTGFGVMIILALIFY